MGTDDGWLRGICTRRLLVSSGTLGKLYSDVSLFGFCLHENYIFREKLNLVQNIEDFYKWNCYFKIQVPFKVELRQIQI